MKKSEEIDVEIRVDNSEIIAHIEDNNLTQEELEELKVAVDSLLAEPDKISKYSKDFKAEDEQDADITIELSDVIEYIETYADNTDREDIQEALIKAESNIVTNWKLEYFKSVMDDYDWLELETLLPKK